MVLLLVVTVVTSSNLYLVPGCLHLSPFLQPNTIGTSISFQQSVQRGNQTNSLSSCTSHFLGNQTHLSAWMKPSGTGTGTPSRLTHEEQPITGTVKVRSAGPKPPADDFWRARECGTQTRLRRSARLEQSAGNNIFQGPALEG